MTGYQPSLSLAERVTLELRGLYEQYGYRKYQVAQFEEYAFYLQFRSFLSDSRILSFTDLDGRLLALKPDVTLSIAKNARLDNGAEKVYYIENVYRENNASGTMREINQMGLEYIGAPATYAQAEVLSLAVDTLGITGAEFVMDVSHMGFVQALFDALDLEDDKQTAILKALAAKSPHAVYATARDVGIGGIGLQILDQLTRLSGAFDDTLAQANRICLNGQMTAALDELRDIVCYAEKNDRIHLDLTQQGDLEYYDGLLMTGYLEGVPRAVLSGGRYDGLMKKLGKETSACGFALYLDELDRMRENGTEQEANVLVLEAGGDEARLLHTVKELINAGNRVRVEREIPKRGHFGKVYRFTKEGLKEC